MYKKVNPKWIIIIAVLVIIVSGLVLVYAANY